MHAVTTSPADPLTAALLEAYFAERAAGFAVPGGYRTVSPDPAVFTPPDGVFLRLGSDDGSALACGGIRLLADEPGRTYEVKHLFVAPAGRGRGFGRDLLTLLEGHARAQGATRLVLDTNRSLVAAGGLYRSSGFVTVAPYNENPNATDWYAKTLA